MKVKRTSIEELFLRIFKWVVLAAMSVALVAVVALLAVSAYNLSQSPAEPMPAQKAPEKRITLEDLRNFLIEEERRRVNKDEAPRELPAGGRPSLRFLEEATALYRCAATFGKNVGAEVETASDTQNAQFVEDLRSRLERGADGSPLRGEPWIKAVVSFACNAFSDPELLTLKKDKKVGKIFMPIIQFHVVAWDRIEMERREFEQKEERRVASERSAEAARVAQARVIAMTCLIGAGSAFAVFMVLALYLLASKAENDLREIGEAVRELRAWQGGSSENGESRVKDTL